MRFLVKFVKNIGTIKCIGEKIRKISLVTYVAIGVCAVHLAAISWAYYQTSFEVPKINISKRSVVVRTVKLNADKEKAARAGEKMIAEAPSPTPKAKPSPPKEKVETKKSEKKNETPKAEKKSEQIKKVEKKKEVTTVKKSSKANKESEPKKKDKKEIDKAKKKILQQVQESIANIEGRSDKLVASLKNDSKNKPVVPGKIEGLSIETKSFEGTNFNDKESAYSEELAARIRLFMKLPEYGSVDVALVLKRSGEFVSLKILGSESARNKAYVESILPTVSFSPFGKSFATHDTYTFHITLTNE